MRRVQCAPRDRLEYLEFQVCLAIQVARAMQDKKETKTLLPGTNFDLDTGTFTCTVPGTYVFMFSATKNPSSNLHVHLRKNGDAVVSGLSNDGSPYEQVSGSGVLVLQQGDKVYLTIYGRAFSESAYPWTSFSGFLLYPE
ncbi:caprin-2-like [Patiria miniata]|uniref:C1q domain-containing protein n=1 Tax=Patiria miniata TaxID=46514 RepID=A0A914AJA2_PATMI|nr:caprin-2-like [Patiria miniata]